MRQLIAATVLTLLVPVCIAQSATGSRLINVSTPALHFIGLAAATEGAGSSSVTPRPNAPQNLRGVTIVLNVPFSFDHPQPQLKGAVIRCILLFRANSAHIAEEQLAVALNGQSTSGTAPVTFAPFNNRNLTVAHAYTCLLEVSNGRSTTFALGDKGPPWSHSQAGSVLLVRGTIDYTRP